MSRLDSVIRRLQAQRACIDRACEMIADRPGLVLEIGLGNGRTFDHLRDRLPDREIHVFERQVAAHPACIPEDRYLFLGDVLETLPRAVAALGRSAILVHSDISTPDPEINRRILDAMAETLPKLMLPGAILLSDQAVPFPGAETLPLPDGVRPGRYFFCRAA